MIATTTLDWVALGVAVLVAGVQFIAIVILKR